LSRARHEHRVAIGLRSEAAQEIVAPRLVVAQRENRVIADRHDALLPALPPHLHLLRHHVEIAATQALELGETHAGGVEELEHREIPRLHEPTELRARLGHREQQVDLYAVEIAWEILVELRRADSARGIRVDDLVAMEIAIEAAHRGEGARHRSLA